MTRELWLARLEADEKVRSSHNNDEGEDSIATLSLFVSLKTSITNENGRQ